MMARLHPSHSPYPRLHLEVLEDRTLLSSFAVDRLTDSGQGSGLAGDLRYCISQATDGDSIQFSVQGIINLTHALPDLAHSISIRGPGRDTLTVSGGFPLSYRIFTVGVDATVVTSGLTLANGYDGPDADGFGGGILNNGTLTVDSCTLSENHANDSGGAIFNQGTLTVTNSTLSHNTAGNLNGGAIYNLGTLTVSSTTFSGNAASDAGGGAIYNGGSLTVTGSAFSSNQGAFFGGGIYNAGSLTLSKCFISGNSATSGGNGGGIYNTGMAMLSENTLSANSSGRGGGIYNGGTLTLTSNTIDGNTSGMPQSAGGILNNGTLTLLGSTISGNTGGFEDAAGGILNGGALTISNSTITGNKSGGIASAGGIANFAFLDHDATTMILSSTIANNTVVGNDQTGSQLSSRHVRLGSPGPGKATVQLRNTIVSGDGSRPNLYADAGGTFVSQGHNLSSDSGSSFLTGPGDIVNADPLLGPLQDNGGPTQTLALLPGSPALDTGDNNGAPDFDQRGPGFPRIVGGIIDIGAFEVQPGPVNRLQITAPAQVTSNTPFDVTVAALDVYGHAAAGYQGTVTFTSTDTDPSVVLPANYPFTAADNGVHTFASGVRLRTLGSHTVTATDTLVSSLSGSTSVVVSPPLFVVTTTLDSGPGSLRQAILDADATPGPDIIRFAIGTGPQTINLAAPLPAITQPLLLDGASQPGYAGAPLIELNGAGAGTGADGLLITAGGCTVRGLVINRFTLYGIELQMVGGNVIQGNYIGTDLTGSLPLGNGVGVRITTSSNMIGGTTTGAGNVISGNLGDGIFVSDNATGNLVQGNFVGTDASSTLNLGNAGNGMHFLGASGNVIGGTADGAANVIACNGNDGVLVDTGSANGIRRNAIHSHTNGLGIELINGANSRLPFPVLTSAVSDGHMTTISGLLQSTPNTPLTLEFFANLVCNPSGFGEGQQLLGASTVTTNSHGTASFTVMFAVGVASGRFIAATATDTSNNTSEFSNCVVVAAPGAPPPSPAPQPHDPGAGGSVTLQSIVPISASSAFNPGAMSAGTESSLESRSQPLERRATEILFDQWHLMEQWPADIALTKFREELLQLLFRHSYRPTLP